MEHICHKHANLLHVNLGIGMLRKIKWSKVLDNGICQNLSLKLSPEKKIKMFKFLSTDQIGKKYLCMYHSIDHVNVKEMFSIANRDRAIGVYIIHLQVS